VGLCGIAALLLSFFGTPWISNAGDDLTFKDLRDIFHPEDETTPAAATAATPAAATPEPGVGLVGQDHLENLKQYTDWGWGLVLYLSVAGVVFSTWIVPRDRAGRVLTGTLTTGCLGWVNVFDKDGSGPRVLSSLVAIYVVLMVAGNAWYLFWDVENSPDPAYGALLGIAGAFAVLAACIMGTKREWVPA
jgi:hypothetical protein